MKAKSCLVSLLIVITLPILVLLINGYIPRKRTYYIPQAKMHIVTICTPKNNAGYIFLGKDSNLSLSDSTDYIRVSKRIGQEILVNGNKKNIYVSSYVRDIVKNNKLVYDTIRCDKNPVHYIMEDVIITDTCFFEVYDKCHYSKNSTISIIVGRYFESVKVRDVGEDEHITIESS